MNDPQDPPRLVDDAAGSARLRALLEEGRRDVGTTDDVRQLESRLVPLIWPPMPPTATPDSTGAGASGAAAGAKAAAGSGIGVKAGLVAIAVGLAGGGLWLAKTKAPARVEPPATTAAADNKSPNDMPAGNQAAAPPPEEAAPTPGAPEAIAPELPASGAKERNTPAAERASESDLLGRAHAALRTDPARALALADEHRKTFPNGILAQEREVLSIEALERLGRHKEAVARADRFLRNFPGSAHRSKVNAVIGRE